MFQTPEASVFRVKKVKITRNELPKNPYQTNKNPSEGGALSAVAAKSPDPTTMSESGNATDRQKPATVGKESPTSRIADNSTGKDQKKDANAAPGNPAKEHDPEELAVINELKSTDREVRAHEAAHVAAGGQYVQGGASFEYKTGPDGKRYAVGGEVQIDTSEVPDDPQATIEKMEVVKRAALAPKNPSSQDRSVAAAANRAQAQARIELQTEKKEESEDGGRKTAPKIDIKA
jgi:hypothetical protein